MATLTQEQFAQLPNLSEALPQYASPKAIEAEALAAEAEAYRYHKACMHLTGLTQKALIGSTSLNQELARCAGLLSSMPESELTQAIGLATTVVYEIPMCPGTYALWVLRTSFWALEQ